MCKNTSIKTITTNLTIVLFILSNVISAQTVKIGKAKALNPEMIGVNANLTTTPLPHKDKKLVGAVTDMGVNTIRYPGGTIGNYWDWDIGWIDKDVPDSVMIKWVVQNNFKEKKLRYTIEHFASLVKQTNTKAVFMLNMLSKDLEHSLRNLRRARDLGLEIKYVEMGNELYFDLPLPRTVYPTPEKYGKTCKIWIDAIKKEFPDAECAIVGTTLERHQRQIDWTNRVLAHCPNADAVTFHKYSPASLDGSQERINITAGTEGLKDRSTATRTWPADEISFKDWELTLLNDSKARTNMWVTTQHNANAYKKMKLKRNIPLWVTEFNMRDDHSVVLDSWAHALILSVYYLEFLKAPVEVTSVHNLVGRLFGQIYAGDSADKLGESKNENYRLTAGGMMTALFAKASKGKSLTAPLVWDNPIFSQNDKGEKFEGIQAWKFWDDDDNTSMILLNFTAKEQKIDLQKSNKLKGKSYSSELKKKVKGWEDLITKDASLKRNKITLPAFSVTVLESYKK